MQFTNTKVHRQNQHQTDFINRIFVNKTLANCLKKTFSVYNVYDFGTDSDSSDNSESVFGGFDPANITRASHAQLAINHRQLSSISSASSSSS